MTTHEPTFARTTDDEILALVLNRAPGIPASVAQQLADHLRSQSERIVWLEHEATELRARVFDKVQVFGGSTVANETVVKPTVAQRFWYWWNAP